MSDGFKGGMERVRKALLLLLGVAVGTHIAYWLLAPTIPALVWLVAVVAIGAVLVRR